jgi:hypothetical protein
MKLIPEARNAWRFLSMQVATVAIVFGTLPADTQAAMLDAIGVPANRVPVVLGALFMLARLVSFRPPQEPPQ